MPIKWMRIVPARAFQGKFSRKLNIRWIYWFLVAFNFKTSYCCNISMQCCQTNSQPKLHEIVIFYQYISKKFIYLFIILGNGSSAGARRQKLQSVSKFASRFFLECQRGDHVQTTHGDGTIHVVDPFNKTLDFTDGSSASVHDIVLPGKPGS